MIDTARGYKLTKEQKDFVLMQIAREHSPSVVVSELQSEYGVTVTRQNIEGYKKKHPALIAEKRRMFLASMSNIPLFEKAERIAELQRLYDGFVRMSAGLMSPETIKTLTGIIAQIQKEVEPIKIEGEGFGSNTNIYNLGAGISPEFREIESRKLKATIKLLRNGDGEKGAPAMVSRLSNPSDN